jgi:flagellar basal-body rod protein FlgB
MTIQNHDTTIELLRNTLGRTATRLAVTGSNLVNVDTPGYRALRAEFLDALGQAHGRLELSRTNDSHVGGTRSLIDSAEFTQAPITRMRLDGNTVDLDVEMTELARLQGRFRAAVQLVRKRFALLRYAAMNGR